MKQVIFQDTAQEIQTPSSNKNEKNDQKHQKEVEIQQQKWKKWNMEKESEKNLKDLNINLENYVNQNNHEVLKDLTMKITERFRSEMQIQKNDNTKKPSDKSMKMEKTIAKEIESNTCPICYELMIPPNYSPILLFPCGHTFCKACVMHQGTKQQMAICPFCRKKVQSNAINLSLQNLICTYTNNRHLLEQYVEQTDEQEKDSLKEEKQTEMNTNFEENYKMYQMRCKIIEEELDAVIKEKNQFENKKEIQMTVVETLRIQRLQVEEKIRKLQEELKLVAKFQDQNEKQLEQMDQECKDCNIKYDLLKKTLEPLKREKDKYSMLALETKINKK